MNDSSKQNNELKYQKLHYPDGNIYFEGRIVDKKEQGNCIYYYNNSNIWTQGEYVNGRKEGTWKYYYSNGKLHSILNFVNGRRKGVQITYSIEEENLLKSKRYFIL